MSGHDALEAALADTFWHEQAACSPSRMGSDQSTRFVPTVGDYRSRNKWLKDTMDILPICEPCEVREQCAAFARREGIEFGVWGGRVLGRGPDSTGRLRARDRLILKGKC